MSDARDNFPAAVRRTLALRVGWRCSVCGRATSARHTRDDAAVSTGVAAHITAAAEGGPRYDKALLPEQRAAAANGIWACGACGLLIDRDDSRYTVDELLRIKENAERAQEAEMQRPRRLLPPRVSVSRLPETGSLFLGRGDEIRLLHDAWSGVTTRILVLHAVGGLGKTALIQAWLRDLAATAFAGADRVFAWSFYSQGSDRNVSADPFIETALEWFDDPDPKRGSLWQRGERLARLLKAAPSLLVLDGLEPLQFPPGVKAGHLKDVALRALLTELAAANPGLVVVTTRLPLAGLAGFADPFVHQHALTPLDPFDARALLQALGTTTPNESDYDDATAAFEGHALALTLLGTLLVEAHAGDLRRWPEVGPLLPADAAGHAERVFRRYRAWLGESSAEVAVLELMGLFDRPAGSEEIAALRNLMDALPRDEQQWARTLAHLRETRLLHAAHPDDPDRLDAHPIVREYFGRILRESAPATWRAGHERLFELLVRKGRNQPPETLADLAPLYAAVGHGREAGRYADAIRVYHDDIHRGDQYYGVKRLGSSAMDLVCLSGFFTRPWTQLVSGLTVDDQGMILNNAGFHLRNAGRLRDAAAATLAAYELRFANGMEKSAAVNAVTLSEISLLLGDIDAAERWADIATAHARKSGAANWIASSLAAGGTALRYKGSLDEALRRFMAAEAEQRAGRKSRFRILYSTRGVQYCELLISRGELDKARRRGRLMLKWAQTRPNLNLLDVGLTHLVLARAAIEDPLAVRTEWEEALAAAEDALLTVDAAHHYTRLLLARGEGFLRSGDLAAANAVIRNAIELARRNELILYEAEGARLLARLS